MTDAQTRIFGWCATQGKADQFHDLCRREYTTTSGVQIRCSCPNHTEEETP